jgi:hypothetical protein
MAKLKITFKDGKIVSQTNGVAGSSCLKVDEFLNNLGQANTQLTQEYYNKERASDVVITGFEG